jgi:hypothetical protein
MSTRNRAAKAWTRRSLTFLIRFSNQKNQPSWRVCLAWAWYSGSGRRLVSPPSYPPASCAVCCGRARAQHRVGAQFHPLRFRECRMPSSLPPIPPPLVTPQIVQLPISLPSPNDKPSGRVRLSTLRRIGAVIVAWGRLENTINDLIWTINGKTISGGRLDTQDLDITKLLAALQKAISTQMPGDRFKNERRSITDLISKINEFKGHRNAVVHGTWAELNGFPCVGSLRFETTHDDLITFEKFDHERLEAIEKVAANGIKNAMMMIVRLEALRNRPYSPQRKV